MKKRLGTNGGVNSPVEQELIRACFQVDEGVRRNRIAELISLVDWPRFHNRICHDGCAPWVMHQLLSRYENHLPRKLVTEWRERLRLHAAYCMRNTGVMLKIARQFLQANIPVVFFKGPVLGQVAYGDYVLRTYQDLDIMIRSEDLNDVYKLLSQGAGFKPMRSMNSFELLSWARGGREFMFHHDGIYLDLHMRLTEGPSRFASDFVLPGSSYSIEILSRKVPRFSPEVDFIILALHGTKHGWPELRMVGDAAFLAHVSGLDMDEVDRLAGHYNCRRAVDLTLWLGHAMCGLKVERYLTGGKTPLPVVFRAGEHIATRLKAGNWMPGKSERLRMMLGLLDSLPARASFVWHTATAPKLTDIRESGDRHPWLLSFLRPFKLFRRRIRSWTGRR